MKPFFSLLLSTLFISASLNAYSANETVMYKKIDKDGNVVFTDKPIPGSKPVKIKTDTNVVETPKVTLPKRTRPNNNRQDQTQQEFSYDTFAIDAPKNDEAIRANDGNINVVVGLSPRLLPNHSVQLKLDGKDISQAQKVPYFSLSEMERGTHELQAVIVDDETGEEVQNSETITFHILIASRLNNKKRRNRR